MLFMNCNKCGTPILPGENTCRFCGAIGDFSVRKEKPEIISFDDINDNYERINFSLGEDEVSINPEQKPQPVVIDVPAVPIVEEPVVITETPVVIEEKPVVIEPVVEQPTIIEATPVVEVPVEVTPVEEVVAEQPVVVEEPKIPVVNSVIDEPPTAKIPVEEVQKIMEAEKETEVIEEVITEEPVVKEEVIEEPVVEEKKEEKEPKATNYKGFCIVLAIFLLASIILNCILLFNASGDSSVVKASESSLVNLKTVYKNYKFSLPYSWVVNGDSEEYLLIHNESETWAASISLSEGLDYTLISQNINEIKTTFSLNKYALTSDYVKTVNGKEFQIFKGKYASHTVYVIINQIDDDIIAVTDLKFKGEVDDEVINNVLKCLTNVNKVDMEKFTENEFQFENVNPLLEGIISKVEEE